MAEPVLEQGGMSAVEHVWEGPARGSGESPHVPAPPECPQLRPVRGQTELLDAIELLDVALPAPCQERQFPIEPSTLVLAAAPRILCRTPSGPWPPCGSPRRSVRSRRW